MSNAPHDDAGAGRTERAGRMTTDKATRKQVIDRAGRVCQQCGVPQYEWVYRHPDGRWERMDDLDSTNASLAQSMGWDDEGVKLLRAVLMVAFLDHDTANKEPDNMRAYCQRCWRRHLETPGGARQRRIEAGQLELGVSA